MFVVSSTAVILSEAKDLQLVLRSTTHDKLQTLRFAQDDKTFSWYRCRVLLQPGRFTPDLRINLIAVFDHGLLGAQHLRALDLVVTSRFPSSQSRLRFETPLFSLRLTRFVRKNALVLRTLFGRLRLFSMTS